MSPGDTGDTPRVTPVSPKPSLEPSINYPRMESHIPAYVGNRAGAHEGDAYGGELPASADAAAESAQAPGIDASGGSHQPAGASTAPRPAFVPSRNYDDADGDVEACPRWRGSMPHTVGPHGRCIDCGAPAPSLVNTMTGEIHQ